MRYHLKASPSPDTRAGAVGAWTLAPGPHPDHQGRHLMPQIPESPFYTAILMPPAGAAGAVGAVGAVGAWTLAPGPHAGHLGRHLMPQIPDSPFHSAIFTRSPCPFL